MSDDRLSELFARALDCDTGGRRELLDRLATEDAELAAELARLLAAAETGASPLDRSPWEGLVAEASVVPGAEGLAGQILGAYTLVAPLGQGGMGSVWLAERSDGRFAGVVAIKLLNGALVGGGGVERFQREGEILARLRHPNIAQLFDAGMSPLGQPYLVLERVEGEPIDTYCDSHGLGIESRLRLFLDVLSAVAHAHANLVVHRDIKPSNVLVSRDGQVKLLDFGIAKLLEGDDEEGLASALTRDAGRVFTPRFAAPEQLAGEAITTGTDVYALGVLLYLLLGGDHPAESAVRSPAELVQAIVGSEPRRLSELVVGTRSRSPEELSQSAAQRSSTPERLRRLLRGDLDTIVAKALKKRPAERYGSVTAFADDVRRTLEHQPIRARPDSAAYRAAKFIRRHRIAVALATLAAVALSGGLVGTLTQARRAERQAAIAGTERDFALRQLARAEALNELDFFLLTDAAPGGQPFTVGDLLGRAEQIVQLQHDQPREDRAEMLVAIGRQYQIQEDTAKALKLLTAAYELTRDSPERSSRARAACALAGAVAQGGDFEHAEGLVAEGLAELGDGPLFALLRVFCLLRGSDVARHAANSEQAVERVLAAKAILRESDQGSSLLQLRVAMDVAESYRTAGRNREASSAFADAWARLEALGRDDSQTAGTLLNNWALVMRSLGSPKEAERLFRRAIEIGSADAGDDGVSPMLLNNYGRTLSDLGRLEEGRRYAERAYSVASRTGNEVVVTFSLYLLSLVELQLGEVDRGARLLAELEPRVLASYPPGHLFLAVLESQKGLLAEARGDLSSAAVAHDRAIAMAESSPPAAPFLPTLLLRRSALALRGARLEAARTDAERALELERQSTGPGTLSSRLGEAYLAIARTLAAEGKLDAAQAAFGAAREQLEPTLGADHPDTVEARSSS